MTRSALAELDLSRDEGEAYEVINTFLDSDAATTTPVLEDTVT